MADVFAWHSAWHNAKDWIKNDPLVSSSVRDRVEQALKQVKAFRIAADFANGTKHMVLTSPRPENAQFTERRVTINLGQPGPSLQERFLTLADGSQTTAEAVATELMREWSLLLQRFGLIRRGEQTPVITLRWQIGSVGDLAARRGFTASLTFSAK